MITAILPQPALDKDSPVNQWLNENPAVLGAGFLILGAILCTAGVRELRSGVAKDKYGTEHSGGMARTMSVVRVVGGVAAAGFGLYKLIAG